MKPILASFVAAGCVSAVAFATAGVTQSAAPTVSAPAAVAVADSGPSLENEPIVVGPAPG